MDHTWMVWELYTGFTNMLQSLHSLGCTNWYTHSVIFTNHSNNMVILNKSLDLQRYHHEFQINSRQHLHSKKPAFSTERDPVAQTSHVNVHRGSFEQRCSGLPVGKSSNMDFVSIEIGWLHTSDDKHGNQTPSNILNTLKLELFCHTSTQP